MALELESVGSEHWRGADPPQGPDPDPVTAGVPDSSRPEREVGILDDPVTLGAGAAAVRAGWVLAA